jgi:hypothetical protein
MRAAEQWRALEQGLPENWEEARLSFTVEDPASLVAAAGVLAPLGPGRAGSTLRFYARPSGPAGAESVRNLVERLDRKRIWGGLELVEVRVAARAEPAVYAATLTDAWDELLDELPRDWSDLFCELEVDSSDFLPRAALHGAPLNPTRNPGELALRFRIGRKGYGTSPAMARRCFERMEAEGMTGRLRVLNSLSSAEYVATQGPVWRVAGRPV